jgi:DNA ligase (NAD+)
MSDILSKLKAANLAYRAGTPIMSDAEFDALEDVVRSLPDPKGEIEAFLNSIGAPADSRWVKIRHLRSMTSLNKAQTPAEFDAWKNSVARNQRVVWSEKLDGLSVQAVYKDGVLVTAAKRGDGDEGEDITRNVIRMKGVPRTVPGGYTGTVRAEIILKRSDHWRHFRSYANPRNAAAGISNRLDGGGCEHLTVIAYHMDGHSTKIGMFEGLKNAGFLVPNYGVLSREGADTLRTNYDRDGLDYDIDGLVFELDDQVAFESLGEVSRRPRGAVAFKFASAVKPTTLKDIVWQVGKSGRVTPVAIFNPVQMVGATVERATLHNLNQINTLTNGRGFTVGDSILVSRNNDVIPGVQALVLSAGGAPLSPPKDCPECGTVLVRDGEYIVCRGEECPAQVIGSIRRWVKKIGVLGIGDAVVEALVEAGKINDPADLYTMTDISGVMVGGARLGSSAATIMEELNSKRELPLYVLVGSLGIPLCSRSVCRVIEEAGFDTLEKMRSATAAQIAAIPGMGLIKAQSFVSGLAARKCLINRLLLNGITVKVQAQGSLTGQSFCFTGIRDPALEAAIEAAGGSVKSSVGKGLTFLVAKDPNASSGKLDKARQQGTRVISLDDARKMV